MDRLVKRTRFHKQKIGRPIYEFFFHRQKICRSVNEFVLISRRSADLLKNLFSYTENRQIYLWFCFHKQKIGRPIYEFYFHNKKKIGRPINEFVMNKEKINKHKQTKMMRTMLIHVIYRWCTIFLAQIKYNTKYQKLLKTKTKMLWWGIIWKVWNLISY